MNRFLTSAPFLIIGATGHIGSALAFMSVAMRFSSHLILFGRDEKKLLGMREELYECGVYPIQVDIITEPEQLTTLPPVAFVAYTVSVPFRKETTREELLLSNGELTARLATAFAPYIQSAKLLVCVSNPADAMGLVLQQQTGLAPEKVCSLSALDTTRYRKHLSRALHIPLEETGEVYTLGSHDDKMVVAFEGSRVHGIPLSQLVGEGKGFSYEDFESVEDIVVRGGRFIIRHRGYMAFESPALLMLEMFKATLEGQKPFTIPASRLSEHPLFPNVFMALPSCIDTKGVHQNREYAPEGRDLEKLTISYNWLKDQREELIRAGYLNSL
ncbi:hypothetical protein HQ39_05155 [Porphyromonas sp. COT-108 OH2963]|uniref:lactate/malate family dehydrogenase n=1 Tax=Porphyromonas sp. COT-108 OH2963 TaxID=1515614 RepID=UPI00052B58B0|nr:hypothetical protein [Porphyromonas sp. COT-108 OH2963]KGN95629.1 hypothetical protein HQ39_05155 [Porphyromonas sp. COT-108 OH2963]